MDDQCDKYDALPWLLEMKKLLPNLKANLFAIPGKCSVKLLIELGKYDWIRLIPHGYTHDTNHEFATLNYKEANDLIFNMIGWDRGFKAPGWQISEDTMRVLRDRGFWVAVQFKNGHSNKDIKHQPPVIEGLKYYAINELKSGYKVIHGHTWETCNNGPKDLEPILKALPQDAEFEFINDYVKAN